MNDFKRIKYCTIPPFLLVFVMLLFKLVEISGGSSFHELGVYPRHLHGLYGVVLAVFIHSDFNHLASNSLSLFILFTCLLYFYKDLSYRVLIFVWLVSGVMVWIGARPSYHIGASGVVYGLASFLFFSGVIRRDIRLMAVSLLVVFLYGGLIWGVFPIFPRISWEYHLFGGLCGLIAAIIYRNRGPQRIVWSWELESDDSSDEFTESSSEILPNEND